MRAYRFRLEAVARVRRVESLLARGEVGRAATALSLAAEREHADDARYHAALVEVGELESAEFVASSERGSRLGASLAATTDARKRLAGRLRQARTAAAEAERRVAVLDRLGERGRREWLTGAQREDVAVLDDFATVRAASRLARSFDDD